MEHRLWWRRLTLGKWGDIICFGSGLWRGWRCWTMEFGCGAVRWNGVWSLSVWLGVVRVVVTVVRIPRVQEVSHG